MTSLKGSSSSKRNRDLQGNDKSDNGTKMSRVKIQESQPAKKEKDVFDLRKSGPSISQEKKGY